MPVSATYKGQLSKSAHMVCDCDPNTVQFSFYQNQLINIYFSNPYHGGQCKGTLYIELKSVL